MVRVHPLYIYAGILCSAHIASSCGRWGATRPNSLERRPPGDDPCRRALPARLLHLLQLLLQLLGLQHPRHLAKALLYEARLELDEHAESRVVGQTAATARGCKLLEGPDRRSPQVLVRLDGTWQEAAVTAGQGTASKGCA